MAEKVKEVVIEEAERVKTLTREAASSGAYLYPLRVSRSIETIRSTVDLLSPGCRGLYTTYPTVLYGDL